MSKINFIELGIRNFQSYGNNLTKVNLDFTEPTLIVGSNLDSVVDGQVDSNGAGKTTILNALVYTLYGKPLSAIKVTNLINNTNSKNMYTYVIMERNGTYYKIERYRKNKSLGGDGVRLLINDSLEFDDEKHDKTPDSINNTNTFIEETVLGIPFEIFSRIVVFSARHESFLSLPVTSVSGASQRSILEELFNFLELTDKAKRLKVEIKNNKTELSHLEEMQKMVDSYKKELQEQFDDLTRKSEQWESENKANISKAESRISELKKIDIAKQLKAIARKKHIDEKLTVCLQEKRDLVNANEKIDINIENHNKWKNSYDTRKSKLENELLDLSKVNIDAETDKVNEYDKLVEDKSSMDKELSTIADKIKTTLDKIEKLENELNELNNDKCPYCKQDYHGNTDKKGEITKKIRELEDVVSDCEPTYAQLKGDLAHVKKRLSSVNPSYTLSELQSITKRVTAINAELNELEKSYEDENSFNAEGFVLEKDMNKLEIEKLEERIEELQLKLVNVKNKIVVDNEETLHKTSTELEVLEEKLKSLHSSSNPYVDSLNKLENKTQDDNDKSNKINDLVDTIKHQEFLLKLINKNDSFVRKALLQENLPLLNERINHYLKKIGLPHHVSFDETLQCHVMQFGKEIPHENLSSGQQARVNIALSFAFRDILQIKHQYVNLCLLDEALDVGLGNVGVQLSATMIKNIAHENNIAMFVISHRDEVMNLFNNVMSIELKDGFSTIEKDG